MRKFTYTLSDEDIENILNRLQGYDFILNTDDDETLPDMDYDNAVLVNELQLFFNQALSESLGYCFLQDYPRKKPILYIPKGHHHGEKGHHHIEKIGDGEMEPHFKEAVLMWTSGLVWRKYNIREHDNIDETNTVGYGDSLIINAKGLLKPFRYKSFSTW